MSGVFCATGSACGANQPSCGYEFTIISRAASPYDCQAKVAATPMQNAIRKRARAREARLRTGGCSFSRAGGRTGGGSVDGSTGNKPAGEPRIVFIIASLPSQSKIVLRPAQAVQQLLHILGEGAHVVPRMQHADNVLPVMMARQSGCE